MHMPNSSICKELRYVSLTILPLPHLELVCISSLLQHYDDTSVELPVHLPQMKPSIRILQLASEEEPSYTGTDSFSNLTQDVVSRSKHLACGVDIQHFVLEPSKQTW